jgi:hypothetical protein
MRLMLLVVALVSVLSALGRVWFDLQRRNADAARISIQGQLDATVLRKKRLVEDLSSPDPNIAETAKVNLKGIDVHISIFEKQLRELQR